MIRPVVPDRHFPVKYGFTQPDSGWRSVRNLEPPLFEWRWKQLQKQTDRYRNHSQ